MECSGGLRTPGSTAYLVKLAKEDPKTFMPLLAKLLPAEAPHTSGNAVLNLTINLGDDEGSYGLTRLNI